jgi:gamma-glutamyltranspeptidase/glutathione hydrolase
LEWNEVGRHGGQVAIFGRKDAVAGDAGSTGACRLPRRWTRARLTILVPALLVGFCAFAARPFRGGVVATAHPIASAAALSMLDRGGNAVDASVAAAFALAVVDPAHSGLGGGGFALLFDIRSGQTRAIDFREVAPSGASRDMYLRNGKLDPKLVTDGALAVAVPGAVAGYFAALSSSGTLKPSAVLAPAILAARRGFPVTPLYQRLAKSRLDCLRSNPEAARIFLRPNSDGVPDVPVLGTRILQPELARTLELLANQGAPAFYTGKLARLIAAAVKANGGILTGEDLARFRVVQREPLVGSYRGHRIATMPPPSAGGLTLLQVLGMMEIKEPSGVPYDEPNSLHLYAEALRRAFADRAKYLGDPDFDEIPLQLLASPAHLRELLQTYDASRATPSNDILPVPPASAQRGEKHTTHLSVLDRFGNAVALTTTLNNGFGSCLVVPETGILLNDEMDDFAASPWQPNLYGLVMGEGNSIAPGKRPVSSMAPAIVFQKENPQRAMIVVGAAGGSTIPTSVIQIVLHLIDHGMDVVRANAQGRVHHQFQPDELRLERDALDPATVKILEAKGHRIEERDPWGNAQAVLEDPRTGLRYAAPDPRNEGAVLGQD